MSISTQQQTMELSASKSSLKSLYIIGGVSSILQLVAIVSYSIVIAMLGPKPVSAEQYFAIFQSNQLEAFLRGDFLLLILIGLYLGTFPAMYIALRHLSPIYTALATIFTLMGVTGCFATESTFSLMYLGGQYVAAVAEVHRVQLIAAGEAIIASDMWHGTAAYMGGILLQGAGVMISIIMLRSKDFHKVTAYAGLLANGLDLIQHVIHPFALSASAFISMFMGLFYFVWFPMLAWDLFRLSRSSSNENDGGWYGICSIKLETALSNRRHLLLWKMPPKQSHRKACSRNGHQMISTHTHTIDILIIGAGLAGLIAATDLQASGFHPLVVEKGRGVGGRLASCRIGSATFDHGAQFITARTPRFAASLSEWKGLGLVTEWYRGTNKAHIHWRGVRSMTAVPKHLAKSLNVRLEIKMTVLKQEGSHWLAIFENGETIAANAVLLTAPVPQSLALLDAGGVALEASIREQLEAVEYETCIAVMALLNGESNVPQPGFLRFDSGPVGWIADNQAKGISAVSAVTIHATPAFSLEHQDDDRQKMGQYLLEVAAPWLGSETAEFQVHAWRYARPRHEQDHPCLILNQSPPLLIAGDAFGGPRVEGAALSGWAAAEALKELHH